MNLATGTVITDLRTTHTAKDFIAFLGQIDREVPDDLEVHVILDNLATHKTPAVHGDRCAQPDFHFHFTPTYGSWMNLVERWFSALTTKSSTLRARQRQALNADITAWVEHWNADPKPFTWHKTADQILQRLAGYCHAINK